MGDLISRKALFKAWDGLSDEIKDKDLLIDEMIRRTQDAETADAEPVRHGRWIWNELEFTYTCSECKCDYDYTATYGLFDHGFAYASFCPNCGARMDKED